MNPGTDQRIVWIVLVLHMLLTPDMKEVVANAASVVAWINMNMRKVSRTGVGGSTPGNISNSVSVIKMSSPVLIGIFGTSLPCGLDVIQKVGNKQQSDSPGLDGQPQKLDAVFDRKLPDDFDITSIFSKVIGEKIFNGSSGDLYKRCRMNFADDPIQTQISQFMDLGLSTINSLDEGSGLSTPTTIIQGLHMVTIGERLIMFLVKLQRLE